MRSGCACREPSHASPAAPTLPDPGVRMMIVRNRNGPLYTLYGLRNVHPQGLPTHLLCGIVISRGGHVERIFVEMKPFTRKLVKLGLDDEFARVQAELRHNPRAGVVEPGTCGLRKIRMGEPSRGQGKRSGARIYYAFVPLREAIYLLSIYQKNEQPPLTMQHKRDLCRFLRSWGAE